MKISASSSSSRERRWQSPSGAVMRDTSRDRKGRDARQAAPCRLFFFCFFFQNSFRTKNNFCRDCICGEFVTLFRSGCVTSWDRTSPPVHISLSLFFSCPIPNGLPLLSYSSSCRVPSNSVDDRSTHAHKKL
jgi:hypothetical protein